MAVDLNALRDFVTVVNAGSITAAARVLGSPKSTVSKRLQDLEAALAVRLIERSTRALRLTGEGADFFQRAQRLLADADEAIAALHEHAQQASGPVRLSVPVLFGQAFMGQVAAAYRTRHPGTTIEVISADRRVDLVEEGFDAAIRVGQLPDSSLIVRPLTTVAHVAVGAPQLIGPAPAAHPAALASLPCMAHAAGEVTRSTWRFVCASAADSPVDVHIKPVITLSSLPALREAALAAAGLAYLPEFMVQADLQAQRLVLAVHGWQGVQVPLSVVVPSSRHMPLRVRALVDLLVERFGNGLTA
jgi:DNA-binding transcriptional LysR family regulator